MGFFLRESKHSRIVWNRLFELQSRFCSGEESTVKTINCWYCSHNWRTHIHIVVDFTSGHGEWTSECKLRSSKMIRADRKLRRCIQLDLHENKKWYLFMPVCLLRGLISFQWRWRPFNDDGTAWKRELHDWDRARNYHDTSFKFTLLYTFRNIKSSTSLYIGHLVIMLVFCNRWSRMVVCLCQVIKYTL